MSTLFRHPRRLGHVLARVPAPAHLARDRACPAPTSDPAPSACGPRFEELGGAWVKLGQMLALRYDLLPAAYCDELFGLLNQVAPFGYDEVRAIIRQELGAEPEVVFATFEATSFASASIGQVHRATLRSGDQVAVKVQRPRIREILQADIQLMYGVTWLLDWTHLFGATRSREVIDEFARWTADEVDYLVEARQAALLHYNAHGDKVERIARVYRDYTTSRVLTTELIEGIPLIEVMIARRDGDQAYLDELPPRVTTSTGSCATSTGTCSTRCSCSASSTPTCTRPTSSCSPATRSATWTSGSSASSRTASASR